jgi:hypothetical protein
VCHVHCLAVTPSRRRGDRLKFVTFACVRWQLTGRVLRELAISSGNFGGFRLCIINRCTLRSGESYFEDDRTLGHFKLPALRASCSSYFSMAQFFIKLKSDQSDQYRRSK